MAAAFAPIVIFHILTVCNAEHDIVCFVEIGFGKTGRIGRHQRQFASKSQCNKGLFRCFLSRIAAPRKFDIQPVREYALHSVAIARRRIHLPIGKQPRQAALTARGQRDQAVTKLGDL